MDRAAILDRVIAIVGDTLTLDPEVELTEDTNLKDLGADSFDLLDLVTALEDEFNRQMDDDAIAEIATIGQVVDAIVAAG